MVLERGDDYNGTNISAIDIFFERLFVCTQADATCKGKLKDFMVCLPEITAVKFLFNDLHLCTKQSFQFQFMADQGYRYECYFLTRGHNIKRKFGVHDQ